MTKRKKEINHLEKLMLQIAKTQTEMVSEGMVIPEYQRIIASLQMRYYTLTGGYFAIKDNYRTHEAGDEPDCAASELL